MQELYCILQGLAEEAFKRICSSSGTNQTYKGWSTNKNAL